MTASESGTQTAQRRGPDLDGLAQSVQMFLDAVENLVDARGTLIAHLRERTWPAPMKFYDDETHGELALAARLEPDEENGATPFILHMNGVEYDGAMLGREEFLHRLEEHLEGAGDAR